MQVLIADDSSVSRTIVKHTLLRDKLEVLVASSGNEAFALYQKHSPALVVTDWLMPDLTGIELCRRIRENPHLGYTYTIVLTSLVHKKNLVEALEAGADDYVTKPFNPEELLARVRVGLRLVETQARLAEKNRWLEQLALTDALTEIPNRRAGEEWMARELEAARRHGYPLSVVMMDLDHFKAVNDTYGHPAGDLVLKAFAENLRVNVRQSDFYARFGGEEFLAVLPHADIDQALPVMERVREGTEKLRVQSGDDVLSVTASFGLAGYSGRGKTDVPALLQRADEALYSAKSNGRNRVETLAVEAVA